MREHGQSLDMLKALAKDRDIPEIPAPGALEVLVLTQLQGLDGKAFDDAYMEGQIIFHDNWYKRIEYTAHNGTDEAVKAYALAAHKLGMGHHDAVYGLMLHGGNDPHEAAAMHGDKPQQAAAMHDDEPQQAAAMHGGEPQQAAAMHGGDEPQQAAAMHGGEPQQTAAMHGGEPQQAAAAQ